MKAMVYKSSKAEASLSTDHGASSYGVPVLVTGGEAYGRGDVLPSGITAGDLVQRFLEDMDPGPGAWGERTEEAVEMAERFLR